MLNFLLSLLVGAVAGWIACKLMGVASDNWILNIILGLVGSLVGTLIAWIIGFTAHNILASMIVAVAGACLCVFLYKKFVK